MIAYRRDRFDLLAAGDFWLAETPDVAAIGWDAACIRICSWARLHDRAAGRALLFANTHWDHEGIVARRRSAELMKQRLGELAGDLPVILAGDFNSHETDDWMASMWQPVPGELQLIDSYRAVHPQRREDENTSHHFTERVEGMRIDFILHTAEFEATDARIVRFRGDNGESPTDHYPVTSRFQWRPIPTNGARRRRTEACTRPADTFAMP